MPKVVSLLQIEILLLLFFGGTVHGAKQQADDVCRGAHLKAYAFNVNINYF